MRYLLTFTVVFLCLSAVATTSYADQELPPPAMEELVDDDVPGEVANFWQEVRQREYLAAFGSFLMLLVFAVRKTASLWGYAREKLENKWVTFALSMAIVGAVELGTAIQAGEELTVLSAVGIVAAAMMTSAGAWLWGKKKMVPVS